MSKSASFLHHARRGCERRLAGFVAGVFFGVSDRLATRDPDLSIFHLEEVRLGVITATGQNCFGFMALGPASAGSADLRA